MIPNLQKQDVFKPANSPIAMARRTPQWSFDIHTHGFSELVIILNGKGMHITENETYPIKRGDVFIISGNRSHGYSDLDNLNLINIYYDLNELRMPMHDLYMLPGYTALFTLEPAYRKKHGFQSKLRLTNKELSDLNHMVNVLDKELRGQHKGFRFLTCAVFMQIVGYISRCYEQSSNPASQSLLKIGESISYIENNYTQPITLEQLADMAHMSRRSYQRIFRKIMGDSPINYLLGLRLSRAKELLKNKEINITQVAFRSGFQDSNYFSRKFRNIYGISPRHYREQVQHGQ